MKISDLVVIYFSAGAPVAVYFYLQNRARSNQKNLWLETVLTLLFWIPSAVRFFFKGEFLRGDIFPVRPIEISPRTEREDNLYRLQKRFEKIMQTSDWGCSIFEFRETLERYVGLTLASETSARDANEEFFSAAQCENPALAARCFERRNRQRLHFHKASARRDFLQTLARLSDAVSDERELAGYAREFVKTLNDREAEKAVAKIFTVASSKDARQSHAKSVEREKQFASAASASRL